MARFRKIVETITCQSVCCASSKTDTTSDLTKKAKVPQPCEKCGHLPSQSSEPIAVSSEDTTKETEKNVTFADAQPENVLMYGVPFRDSTYDRQVQTGDELIDFFSRPVEIYEFDWLVNTNVAPGVIYPWREFLLSDRVSFKLDTFKLIHGTLNLKILVNGTPFHYGLLRMGVYPSMYTNNHSVEIPNTAVNVTNYRDEFNAGTMSWFPAQVQYSSRPGVFISPRMSEPAMIEWPFFAATDWIDIVNENDYDRLGQLEIWQINQLRHANGGDQEVRVTILAWMTNVQVAGITPAFPAQSSRLRKLRAIQKEKNPRPSGRFVHKEQGNTDPLDKALISGDYASVPKEKLDELGVVFEAQSSKPRKTKAKKSKNRTSVKSSPKASQEYGKNGAISAPASAIANAAGYLIDIPVIGPFAKATEIGANAVSSIASIFGFSKPAVLDKHSFVTQNYYSDMATCSGTDNVIKLSVDPKQELTIDPNTVGLDPKDEMAFLNIAKREALIHSFTWPINTSASGVAEGHTWACRVHPLTSPRYAGVRQTLTPVGFIAYPFRYWTGALRFRIQVVCSQMHAGRLAIAYNPDFSQPVGGVAELNSRFVHIMDISEERDITLEVNWAQPEAYREVDVTGGLNNDFVVEGPIGSMIGNNNFRCNGRLDIYILNRLTAPTDADAFINVYLSAGDSFKVNSPRPIGHASWAASGINVQLPDLSSESSDITLVNHSDNLLLLFLACLYLSRNDFFDPWTNSGISYRRDLPSELGIPLPAQSGDTARVTLQPGENAPSQTSHYVLNGDYDDGADDVNSVYFGESIVSIRTMIKRYCVNSICVIAAPTATNRSFITRYILPIFPCGRQLSPYGSSINMPNQGTDGGCFMTYLRYYCEGFIGYRGGVRWKTFSPGANRYWKYFATRNNEKINVQQRLISEIADPTTLGDSIVDSWNANSGMERSMAGLMVNPGQQGFGPVVEVPYQLPLRYSEIHETATNDIRYSGMFDSFVIGFHGSTFAAGDRVTSIETSCAAAEDSAFFFFVGVTPLYIELL